MNSDNVTYFDRFKVEHIPKEIKKFSRTQASHSVMCGYFFTGSIDFMLKVKSLLDYADLSFSNEYEKYDKITIYHYCF